LNDLKESRKLKGCQPSTAQNPDTAAKLQELVARDLLMFTNRWSIN
jgi:hypothetical protein